MDNIIKYIITMIAIVLCVAVIAFNEKPVPVIKYVPVNKDSTAVKELVYAKELLRRTQDSLNAYKADTNISAELFVAKYKLERIRYYNNIATGTNLKFLRGWINRVLNE